MLYSANTASNAEALIERVIEITTDTLVQLPAGNGNMQAIPALQNSGSTLVFTGACSSGGYTASWNVTNNPTSNNLTSSNLVLGDSVTLNFTNCLTSENNVYTGSVKTSLTGKLISTNSLTLEYTPVFSTDFKIKTMANSSVLVKNSSVKYISTDTITPGANGFNTYGYVDSYTGGYTVNVATNVTPFLPALYLVNNYVSTYESNPNTTSTYTFSLTVDDGSRSYAISTVNPTIPPNLKSFFKGADVRFTSSTTTGTINVTGTNNNGAVIPAFTVIKPLNAKM